MPIHLPSPFKTSSPALLTHRTDLSCGPPSSSFLFIIFFSSFSCGSRKFFGSFLFLGGFYGISMLGFGVRSSLHRILSFYTVHWAYCASWDDNGSAGVRKFNQAWSCSLDIFSFGSSSWASLHDCTHRIFFSNVWLTLSILPFIGYANGQRFIGGHENQETNYSGV